MHPKQGTKESGEGKSGHVKRDAQDTLRDQSGSVPVLLSECLHAGLFSLKQQQQKLLDQDAEGKRNKAHSCDPREHRAGPGRQELTHGPLFTL